MYHVLDVGMIRVSAFPLTPSLPSCPAPISDTAADAENCRQWIGQVWRDDSRADAIELAAPVLAAGIRKVLDGTARRSRIRRTAHSLTRYLLRMQYRATPFGLFAGAAPVRVGRPAQVRWGTQHKAFARADALWLHDIIAALEADPDVLRRLPVVADPTCTVRGAQISVPHQPGAKGPTATTLRRTRAAELALALACTPITVGDIVAKLHADYPNTPAEKIEGMVRGLVAHRVLLTSLSAPMTCDDALGHLIVQLEDAGLGDSSVAPTLTKLRHVHQLLDQHDRAQPAAQRTLRDQASEAINGLAGIPDRNLAVNLRPDCDVVLPQAVAAEAQRALEVIARITPYPNGAPAWQDYRTRFLERYSMGTIVPIRDLTDPDTGLGFPVGYRGTVLKRPVLAMTPRDQHLLALAQDAALSDRREVVLTEDDIEALSVGTASQVPAHIEFTFTVLARSIRALDEGRFTLSTTGLSLAAGTTTGRFLPTLEQADRDRVRTVHASMPTLTAGAVRAQVSSPPLKVPINNVSRSPAVVSDLLAIGEHNPDATLDLDDLGVMADTMRFYLVSLSTGRLIEPSVMNAVELSNSTHPLVRFLCELHRAHTAVLLPFFWGAATRLPFLPEVRAGRTVLSAALWRLHASDLGDGEDWMLRFTNWRIQYGVPRTVYVGSSDQRLRLDLDVPVHQELLRAELRRHDTAVLHEAPEESSYGWAGRAHEVTMLFASDQQPAPAPAHHAAVLADRNSDRMPGSSEWAYVKLYGSAARAPEVLTAHLPRLLRHGGNAPTEAWFVRYADPDPHLRLRLRQPGPEAFGATAQTVAAWAAELCAEGLIQRLQWNTDRPEAGRYGTGATLAAAEAIFVADSTAALAQMSLAISADLQPAVTAASFVDIAAGFLGSRQAGNDWLLRHLLRGDGEPAPRHVQALTLQLTDVGDRRTVLSDLSGGHAVVDAWEARQAALVDYRQALDAAGIAAGSVLPSLLHMHHNRVAGVDPEAEAACRRIARAAAQSWSIRHQGGAQ
ncbi:lantibiotic dehydratase [Streptomyces sp. Ru73]|uniref:lantibiotic dehydratase n=1 Tax=Streptomyces sp. Ru73 TaxID=2080748 RepID=UPI0021563C94|nr:lantibiotic dehydratase [Streptomyces sp. Ru73]